MSKTYLKSDHFNGGGSGLCLPCYMRWLRGERPRPGGDGGSGLLSSHCGGRPYVVRYKSHRKEMIDVVRVEGVDRN
jgi:hypothetical protein